VSEEIRPIIMDRDEGLSHPRRLMSSSAISYVGYDEPSQTLYVTFLESGVTYLYGGVPMDVYEGLMSAESHGRFFNLSVKPYYPQLV
jgi:hypothetical protein